MLSFKSLHTNLRLEGIQVNMLRISAYATDKRERQRWNCVLVCFLFFWTTKCPSSHTSSPPPLRSDDRFSPSFRLAFHFGRLVQFFSSRGYSVNKPCANPNGFHVHCKIYIHTHIHVLMYTCMLVQKECWSHGNVIWTLWSLNEINLWMPLKPESFGNNTYISLQCRRQKIALLMILP